MNKHEAATLLKKFEEGSISPEELTLLEGWYNQRAEKGRITLSDEEIAANLNQIWTNLKPVSQKRKSNRIRIWTSVAASILIISGLFFFLNQGKHKVERSLSHSDSAIVPGGNKAYLTLANGKRISLSGVAKGRLANERGISIDQSSDGEIVYHLSDDESSSRGNVGFNTIETPKGGQYRLILPDGTKIWLNAASKLKYPVHFSNNERKIELSGEGYFEVAKDQLRPFKLVTNQQEITVLGTHFNVSNYPDDAVVQTTLLEGSVRVLNRTSFKNVVLKPDQQASLKQDKTVINTVNSSEAVAWKNGEFLFSDESLGSIMKKIARWYDVEIIYQGISPEERFGGSVSRFEEVAKVLEKLELTGGVHFKIDKRRVIVSN